MASSSIAVHPVEHRPRVTRRNRHRLSTARFAAPPTGAIIIRHHGWSGSRTAVASALPRALDDLQHLAARDRAASFPDLEAGVDAHPAAMLLGAHKADG